MKNNGWDILDIKITTSQNKFNYTYYFTKNENTKSTNNVLLKTSINDDEIKIVNSHSIDHSVLESLINVSNEDTVHSTQVANLQYNSKAYKSLEVEWIQILREKLVKKMDLRRKDINTMTPDELKSIPKGNFVVMKTGTHPMQTRLRLFLDWGIRFGMPYEVPEKAQRFVAYADKQELEESIIRRHYGTIVMDSEQPQGGGTSAGGIAQGIQAAPDSRKTVFRP